MIWEFQISWVPLHHEQDLGKTIVKKRVYETVKYTLKSGSESSRCELVGKDISVANFISDFKKNIFYKYARHSHRSQWLDQQFRESHPSLHNHKGF